jgi:hypothetical protein
MALASFRPEVIDVIQPLLHAQVRLTKEAIGRLDEWGVVSIPLTYRNVTRYVPYKTEYWAGGKFLLFML